MNWLKQQYGSAEGPLGFPMLDRQALVVDSVLKSLPKDKAFEYRRLAGEKLVSTETLPGERSDVSWITTEDPDRQNEVVIAKGMNDSQYGLNPIVTLNHCYAMPPVGKSLWRKRSKDGAMVGIKAKTQYPPTPPSWPEGEEWPPDCAFSLVQSELLRGKSIGFLPTAVHVPTREEREKAMARAGEGAKAWEKVELVIDEWILLEYACVFLPAQQNAVVEAVSKSALSVNFGKALGIEEARAMTPRPKEEDTENGRPGAGSGGPRTTGGQQSVIAFTTLAELEKSLVEHINEFDFQTAAFQAATDALDRHRGRV